ncbi:hypothetical protein F0562_018175 [Nyssa sinensis]|uniref:non-specific serine/threonine protein kinase n=1 Tax=Nyssa sinensis TaxID=561372 RepID=A0A5J4ZBG5_9ASTE|nr:hypothetical protein F0562_018175 [Nyssa sinensis]
MAKAFDVSKSIAILMFIMFILLCTGGRRTEAQNGHLSNDEKNALRQIANELGKKDWDFNQNPCDQNNTNWTTPKREDMPSYNNTVQCNCSYPNGECHVVNIFLKGQDLAGELPRSLAKLQYIKNIDFTRNYLSGTIPPEWISTKLEYLSVTVNRLSGPIPKYLGDMTSLIYMSLEQNQFNGSVPAELGKLINLVNLILNSNNLTGELPVELYNLTNLTELRLSSNNFTGKLPDFHSWKQLQKLEIAASGMEGPIPPSISNLTNLIELRITDLNGRGSKFPWLYNMKNMTKIMLRSCNISGSIPDYIANLTGLKTLDLSFNKLEGPLPTNLGTLANLKIVYLTRNLLTGLIPTWINSKTNEWFIDLSYNNFSVSSPPPTCTSGTLNLFRSFSGGNNLELGNCPTIFTCPKKDMYSLHVNCGGGAVTIGKTSYVADQDPGGLAKFVPQIPSWGTSSTGDFWDTNRTENKFIANNVTVLQMNNSELYMTARLSPLSLTYYARCLAKGNYTVTLHFAEIIFRNNRSYQSLGRRMFDVYIQDELVLKDFDIEHEAHGVDNPNIQKFSATVKNKTLEIRFHWAGKGTTAVPLRGTYGPLISAISVEANFKPPNDRTKKIFIAVGAVALVCLIFMILGFIWWKGCLERNMSREQDLGGLDLQIGLFTYRQIKAATNNFDDANKIGEGGFGSVYKGILLDGTVIAVKQLSSKSKQGNREFVNEIGTISGLQHPNLVRLYGCCIEGNQLLLVYEYMENNSLARALFGPEELQLNLDWPTRQRICIGIAKGLTFLHEESTLKIVHRDIKATNVLLDRDLNPKISDFGLAKLDEEENTHISTRVAGTIGYMAPEYALWGYLTYKADIYSFGVVALEIVAGKNNMKYRPSENYVCLLDWALVLRQKGCLMELVDPKLGSDFNMEEAIRMIKVALLCSNPSPALRPTMSAVVSMLEGHINVHDVITDANIYGDELRLQALRDKYNDLQLQSSGETQTLIDTSVGQPIGSSSTSAQDLYPINLHSQ